jgi:acetyltransferase EpsM
MDHAVSSTLRERLVIVGAGGHGAELCAYTRDMVRSGWNGRLLGYLDDAKVGAAANGSVLGPLNAFVKCPDEFFRGLHYLTAVGNNEIRRSVVCKLRDLYGERLIPWTLVHHTCYLGQDIHIGEGTCLAPGAIVTCRTGIGKHCIVNVKASVSHDCTIGDFVNLNPGATVCGNVVVGEGAYIGAGATVKDEVSIGAWSVIGAGATVIGDIPPNVTAVGVPARVIRQNRVSN